MKLDTETEITKFLVKSIKYGRQVKMCWIGDGEPTPSSYITVGGCSKNWKLLLIKTFNCVFNKKFLVKLFIFDWWYLRDERPEKHLCHVFEGLTKIENLVDVLSWSLSSLVNRVIFEYTHRTQNLPEVIPWELENLIEALLYWSGSFINDALLW